VSRSRAPVFESIPVALDRRHSEADRRFRLQLRHCAGDRAARYETLEEFVVQVESAANPPGTKIHLRVLAPLRRDLSPARLRKAGSPRNSSKSSTAPFGTLITRLSGTQSRIVATADPRLHRRRPEESLERARRACGDAQVSPWRREARCSTVMCIPGAVLGTGKTVAGRPCRRAAEPRAAAGRLVRSRHAASSIDERIRATSRSS